MTILNQFDKQCAFESRIFITIAAFFLILALYIGISLKYIPAGQLNADEGIYCLTAQKTMEGQLPYRDFAYPQMPVLPYMNGLAMKIVGFGYLEQRAVNAFWGLITIAVVFCLVFSTAGRYAALVATWLTATSIYWVHFVCMGKTYAATGLFLILAALGIAAPWLYYRKVLLFTLAGVFAVGTRLSAAPVVFVLWVFLILQADNLKKRIIAAVLPILAGIALVLPFLIADPENFIFWNLKYHLGSTIHRRGLLSIKEYLWLAPGTLLIIATALAALAIKIRQLKLWQLAIFISAIIGIVVQLSLKASYGEYSTPYMPLATVGATVIVSKFSWFKKLCPIIFVLPLLAYLGPKPLFDNYMPDALLNTAKFLRANTSAADKVLTSLPITAVQAQRKVFEGIELGKFALTSEMPEDKALRLHIITPRILVEMVETKKPAAVVINSFKSPWNFHWSIPSFNPADKQQIKLFFQTLNRNYHVAFKEHPFAVFLPNHP